MAWGAKTDVTQLTSITTEQFFDQVPVSTPGELFHIEVEANFPASPTDNLIVALYGTLDDSSQNFDDTPFLEFEIANDNDPNKASFLISGIYSFRIGVRRSGSTDTITSADMSFRRDNVNL